MLDRADREVLSEKVLGTWKEQLYDDLGKNILGKRNSKYNYIHRA